MENDFSSIFKEIFQLNGLSHCATQENIAAFERLTELMLATNSVMNITALETLDKIIPLHYADCALIADKIPYGASVADVGCGGGFPTLPLAILRSDLHITAIDSTEKKVRYVAETAKALGLHVEACAGRAESLAALPRMREQFDIVISRAVARLCILDELCLPLVRVGGHFLAMKGSIGPEECNEALHGMQLLGAGTPAILAYPLHLPGASEQRHLITVPKIRSTPPLYPRAFGKIKKAPL